MPKLRIYLFQKRLFKLLLMKLIERDSERTLLRAPLPSLSKPLLSHPITLLRLLTLTGSLCLECPLPASSSRVLSCFAEKFKCTDKLSGSTRGQTSHQPNGVLQLPFSWSSTGRRAELITALPASFRDGRHCVLNTSRSSLISSTLAVLSQRKSSWGGCLCVGGGQ